ncbi:MAG: hypothetical protein H7844_10480 [Nitrospirae bacterium YQR-1]
MRKQHDMYRVKKLRVFFWLLAVLIALSFTDQVFAEKGTVAPDPIQPSESVTKDLKDTDGPKPSKEETIAYIQEKCDNMKFYDDKIIDRVYLEGCNLILLGTTGKFGEKDSARVKKTVPLADMDPGVIRLGFDPARVMYTGFINSGVQVNSRNEERKISVVRESYDSDGKYRKEEIKEVSATFHCKNETMAQKVAKAAARLIEVCGGKKELF